MLWSCCGSSVPTVLIDFPPPSLVSRTANLAILLDSDEDIGGRGAEYFMKLGSFASYAFTPDSGNRGWSRLRERGYKKILRKTGFDCTTFNAKETGLGDREDLAAIRLLQYPAPEIRVQSPLRAYDERMAEKRESVIDLPLQGEFDSAQVSPCRNGSIGALRNNLHPFVRG